MVNGNIKLCCISLLLLLLVACSGDRLKIDVSDIHIDLKLKRADQDFRNAKAENLVEIHQKLREEHPEFYRIYIENFLNLGILDDPGMANRVGNRFLARDEVKKAFQAVDKEFQDFSVYEEELTEAFKYYHHYFPDSTLPQLVTYVSEYRNAVFASEHYLGIGLDMFLGSDYEEYFRYGYNKYQVEKMTSDYLVYDAMRGWLGTTFEMPEDAYDFLSQIIHYGKIQYLMDATFPYKEGVDHLKMGYLKGKIAWCEENENNMWKYIIENEILRTKEQKVIDRFVMWGPFTKDFVDANRKEAPSRTGVWIGWQIVRAYMENNSDVTIPDLMAETDFYKILQESKYTHGED